MTDTLVVLVMTRDKALVEELVRRLEAQNISVYGTTSVEKAIASMTSQQPRVLVADPGTEECSRLLEKSSGWQSITVVAIAESNTTAEKAEKMGIKDIIRGKDTSAVVAAVLSRLR